MSKNFLFVVNQNIDALIEACFFCLSVGLKPDVEFHSITANYTSFANLNLSKRMTDKRVIVFGFDQYVDAYDTTDFVFFAKPTYVETKKYRFAKVLVLKDLDNFTKKLGRDYVEGYQNLAKIYDDYVSTGLYDDSVYDLYLLLRARFNNHDAFRNFYQQKGYVGYHGLDIRDRAYVDSMRKNITDALELEQCFVYRDEANCFVSVISQQYVEEYARELANQHIDYTPSAIFIVNPKTERIYVRRPVYSNFDCGEFCRKNLDGRGNAYAGSGKCNDYFDKISERFSKI